MDVGTGPPGQSIGGVQGVHEAEDGVDDGGLAGGSVEHHVVEPASGPLHLKVFFDVCHAVAVDSLHKFTSFGFGVAGGSEG